MKKTIIIDMILIHEVTALALLLAGGGVVLCSIGLEHGHHVLFLTVYSFWVGYNLRDVAQDLRSK